MKRMKWIGRILSVVCMVFLGLKLYATSSEIKDITFNTFEILKILGVIIVITLVVYFNVYPWKKILEFIEQKKIDQAGFIYFAHIFTKSNLAKYLPGNVMHYVSRTVLSTQFGFSGSNTVLSIILDTIMIVFTGVFVSLFFLRDAVVQIAGLLNFQIYFIMAGVAFLAVLVGYILIRKGYGKKIEEALRTICSKGFLRACIKPFIFYIVTFMITAVMYYIVLQISAGVPFLMESAAVVTGVYIISWLLGYITPGASGGIGIRETVLLFLLAGYFSESEILTSALVFRVITIIADVLGYLLGLLILKISKKREE